jgi:hypothetical protein
MPTSISTIAIRVIIGLALIVLPLIRPLWKKTSRWIQFVPLAGVYFLVTGIIYLLNAWHK